MSGSTAVFVVTTGRNATGAGSAANPFATLARAQAAMETSFKVNTTTPKGGTHCAGSTLTLTSAHSGETWQAVPGTSVGLSGGQPVTGFAAQGSGVSAARAANPGTVMPPDALFGMIDLTMHPGQYQAGDVVNYSVAVARSQHRNRHD